MVAVPGMTVAPRASASLSIIVSKSLRRTCHVVESERFHSLPRDDTRTYQLVAPLVPKTLTPCLTGYSLFTISSSKPSRRSTWPDSPVLDSPMWKRGNASCSRMTGLIPSRRRNIAIADPPGPPPIINTSVFTIYLKQQSTEFVSHLCAVKPAGVSSSVFSTANGRKQ